jgi:hypothetical protein
VIRGPGTGTSDSILARVSAGEFFVNAAATVSALIETSPARDDPGSSRFQPGK